jgi:sulfatase modifying factor 1
MSAASPLDDESLPTHLVLYIDQVCDHFETALRQGQQPQIEQYLGSAPPAARAVLLHELVALEQAWGRAASLPAYRQRFPDQADLLGRLFATATPRAQPERAPGLFAPMAKLAEPPAARAAPVAVAVPVAALPVVSLGQPARPGWKPWIFLLGGIAALFLVAMGIGLGLALRPSGGQPPIAVKKDPERRFTNSLGMEFALIPAGKFKMGSPPDEPLRHDNEGPQHDVTISRPFLLGIHEVTVGQFRAFVDKSGYRTEAETNEQGALGFNKSTREFEPDPRRIWRNPGWPQSDQDPVVCVSWDDARGFCAWLSQVENRSYRLPTEAEWEYACRGGSSTAFASSNSLSSFQANFNGEFPYGPDARRGPNKERPVKVGSYQANRFGIHDMHGNVTEWCADYFGDYPAAPQVDPAGPASGQMRVQRGGSWFDRGNLCRCAIRGKNPPDSAFNVVGFRVVCRP